MSEGPLPLISVLIGTRNRPSRLVVAVRSILANRYPSFEVIVIDQSDEGQESGDEIHPDRRLRMIRSSETGLSKARNHAARIARGELFAFTDDDCEVEPDWLADLAAAFSVDPRVGIVFGNVTAAVHDPTEGFVPAYVRKQPFLARNIRDKHRVEGIGACMAARRETFESLGGFDRALGVGARFCAAEDTDFVIRALLAGYHVFETPDWSVVHNGFRTWEQGKLLIPGYLFGIGAALTKNLVSGHPSVLLVFVHLARRWAFGRPVVDLGRTPPRLPRISAFLRGILGGASTPVDRATGHFVERRPVE